MNSGCEKLSEKSKPIERLALYEAIRYRYGYQSGRIDQQIAMEQIDFEDMTILLRLSEEKYSIVQFEIKGNSPSVGKCISDLDLPEESFVISVSRNKKLQICKGIIHAASRRSFDCFSQRFGK